MIANVIVRKRVLLRVEDGDPIALMSVPGLMTNGGKWGGVSEVLWPLYAMTDW